MLSWRKSFFVQNGNFNQTGACEEKKAPQYVGDQSNHTNMSPNWNKPISYKRLDLVQYVTKLLFLYTGIAKYLTIIRYLQKRHQIPDRHG